jgi:transposase, IS5 family
VALQYVNQLTFSSYFLQDTLDPEHKLLKLAEAIDWLAIHEDLEPYYSGIGRQALPIRLMVGLHLLKHMENMSDEKCTDRIRGDIYWMYFCNVEPESLKGQYVHLNSSSMTKFRNRIGSEGFSKIEGVIQDYLAKEKKIDPNVMSTDSSCMEKNIAYPTDSGLLDKGRKHLLAGMKELEKLGVKSMKGLRNFSKKSKKIVLNIMKLGKDRAERIEKGTLTLASMAAHVLRKCKKMLVKARRKLATQIKSGLDTKKLERVILKLEEQVTTLEKVIGQARQRFKGKHIKNKIYSLCEKSVIVIRKGKGGKANEYGSKFNISIDRKGFIISHEIYHDSRADTQLLSPAIENWEEETGRLPDQVNADRGYVQKKKNPGKHRQVKRLSIPSLGKRKNPQHKKRWFRKGQKMRAGIEAVIGHLKQDHRINRSRYSGKQGDGINLTLGCMAWNLSKLARVGV